MSPTKLGLAAVFTAGLPLIAMALYWQFGLTSGTFTQPPKPGQVAIGSSPRVGDLRDATLGSLTQLYISRNAQVAARIRSGEELAPVDFLNQELERQGAKWRVRDFDGLIADTYNVS